MVILGVALRFIQESKADSAAAKLKAMIKVTATVVREGKPAEVPLQCLVPGDIVKLCAGDMIPGDVRILTAKDLFIIQATLTGESLPVEKFDARETRENISPLEACQSVLPGHQRGKRHGAGGGGGDRSPHLFGRHRQQHDDAVGRDQLSTKGSSASPT
jgi:magnesium-transporting ATPase (P-type)